MGYSARAEQTPVEYIQMPEMEIRGYVPPSETIEMPAMDIIVEGKNQQYRPVIEERKRGPSVQYFNFGEDLFQATPIEYFNMEPMYFTPIKKDKVM